MKDVNIVVLLDRTGSMEKILNDTICGFNTFLRQQKEQKEVRIKFSLTFFSTTQIEEKYSDVDINEVEELNTQNYRPLGGTPLWDAIGTTINKLADKKDLLFVIITDGEENSSKEYKTEAVKKMIEQQEKEANWQFLYLGVGLENFDDATSVGIRSSHAFSGDLNAYHGLSKTVAYYANTGKVAYDEDDNK